MKSSNLFRTKRKETFSACSESSISLQVMQIVGKGGYERCNFNGICVLYLERGAVRGGERTEEPGPLAAALC